VSSGHHLFVQASPKRSKGVHRETHSRLPPTLSLQSEPIDG